MMRTIVVLALRGYPVGDRIDPDDDRALFTAMALLQEENEAMRKR